MFGAASGKVTHPEGPFFSWIKPDELRLTYLLKGSVEYQQIKAGEEEVLPVAGRFADKNKQYPIRRNPEPAAAEQEGVEKTLVLGDIHGTYSKLKAFLQQNKVIDEEESWCWGRGQLVFSGDVLDRGSEVTETLWLIYRLEQEAARAGGAVHYLLGNHELMVMEGDYRYVHPDYLRLFAAAGLDYGKPFAENTVFGQWLRKRNAVIKLNSLLISHAGISPVLASRKLSIRQINQLLQEYMQNKLADESLALLLTGPDGPLWYRDYVLAYSYGGAEAFREEAIKDILQQFGAKHMSIAHTTVSKVQALYGRGVFAVDLNVNDPRQPLEGLLFKEGSYYRLMADGKTEKL